MDAVFLVVLRKMITALENSDVNWALGGSLSLAIRGAPVEPRDIDILTDRAGSYDIERILKQFVVKGVSLRTSEDIQSHFGALELDGVKIEIMGDFQLRSADGGWDDPPDLRTIKEIVRFGDILVPVLSLEWERTAYSRLGRQDKVDIITGLQRSVQAGTP